MSFETLIRQGKPNYVQADIQEVTSSILQRLDQSNVQGPLNTLKIRRWSWKKRLVSAAAVLGCALIGTGTAALADGVNVLSVVVQFVHNITNGEGFGTSYGLENTTVSLTLKTNDSAPTNQPKGNTGTIQQARRMTTTQMMSDGGLFDLGYNTQLDNYLGTTQYPRLTGDNVAVSNIQAFSIDRRKGIFYMYVGGYIPGSNEQAINFDVYHKTGGTVVINGQTTANIKQQVNLDGINATYVEFTNNQSFLNYLTWKSGDWIFVLRSNNVSEQVLTNCAHNIENQVTE